MIDLVTLERFEREWNRALPKTSFFAYKLTRCHDEADDLLSTAMVRAMRGFHNYRHQCAFSSWVYRILINCHIEALRRRGRHRTESIDAPCSDGGLGGNDSSLHAELIAAPIDVAALVEDILLREQIRDALGNLPSDMKEPLILFAGGTGYEEIAVVLGIPVGTVKSRISRARTKMAEAFPEGANA